MYVLYVLSTGIIDDLADCLKILKSDDWKNLPLQLQVISLAPSNLAQSDQDSIPLVHECNRLNRKTGWPQF